MLASSNSFSLENFRAKAEVVCRAEVDSNPQNVTALVNLGTLLKVKKEHAEAETMFRRALEIDPSSVPALINLGSLMQNIKKDYVEAEQLYRRALAIHPNDSRALIYLGSVLHFAKGQYGAAEDLYRKALETDQSVHSSQIDFGIESSNRRHSPFHHLKINGESGSNESATGRAGNQHHAGPQKQLRMTSQTRLEVLDNLRLRAEGVCRRALLESNEQVTSLIRLAAVLRVKNNLPDAESALRTALKFDSRSVPALLALGGLLTVTNPLSDEAEAMFKQAIAINPKESRALVEVGTICMLKGMEAEGREYYNQAIDADPVSVETIEAQLKSCSTAAMDSEIDLIPLGRANGSQDPFSKQNGDFHGGGAHTSGASADKEGGTASSAPSVSESTVGSANQVDSVPNSSSDVASVSGEFSPSLVGSLASLGRKGKPNFFTVLLSAGQAAAKKDQGGGIPTFMQRFVANNKKNWTKRASALVAKSKFSYFQTFVPRAAIHSLMSRGDSQGIADRELVSELQDLVVLMVDISGFTRLSDRFHGLGQEGIDALTTTINKMFTLILDHVESWGGDVIKFAGDAVIVIWEIGTRGAEADPSVDREELMRQTLVQAIECARTLERDHGEFQVNVPDVMKLAMADQLNRHFASQAAVAITDQVLERKELENLEMRRTLREVSWLKCLTDHEVALLVENCHFVTFQEGDVIMAQGKSSNRLYIIHSGEVKILLDANGAGAAAAAAAAEARSGSETKSAGTRSKASLHQYGTEISVATEGQILGEISFLTGQPHTATVVAARNCSMVMITPQALQPILKCNSLLISELTELMQQHLSSKPKSPAVTLRIHQSIACGRLWLAHMGGEHVVKPHDYGARREFLVMGNALLRAAESLDEAPVGTMVVSHVAWDYVSNTYQAERTKGGNFRLVGVQPHVEGQALCAFPVPRVTFADEAYPYWTQLKLYCHEGARDLQDVAQFAAEVRKMTVLFVRLHLELESPDRATVEDSQRALLAIQHATYSRRGTLRQFLQDDKGLLAICIMGMPPFSPHENDATRGVLAAMDIREALANLGMKVGIGITTGTAYSGFVGSSRRREMCAMGSMVNMSARLMCKADDGVLVDRLTYDAAALMVRFEEREPIMVKGRDEPLEIFAPVCTRSAAEVSAQVLEFVKREFGVQEVSAAVEDYLRELLTMGHECSLMHIRGVCGNLREGGNVRRSDDGRVLVAVTDLTELEHGLTRQQALSRGNFEFLKPYPPSHVQMLAKVACLLSHSAFFSLALVKQVYSNTFPNFADLFDEGMKHLLGNELFVPATPANFAAFFQRSDPEPLWAWARGDLLFSIYAQFLGFKTQANSHLRREMITCAVDLGPHQAPDPDDFTPAFREYLEERGPEPHRFHNVYMVPIPGFVHTLNASLLKTYQRTWHRHAAEFFEQSLDQRWTESHLILAHHWVAAAEYRQTEEAYVNHAVQHLQQSAVIAIEQHAYVQAVEMLQRACNMLDLVPGCEGASERKMGLLFEMAPYTLVVYGHGSVEAIAAYQGLSRLVPKGATLDDRAVLVIAGTCVNLYGKKLFHAGSKLANQIVASADNPRHVAVGWALLVPALYHNGDIEGVLACLGRLRESYVADLEAGVSPPLANGVYITVVALSMWPAALARHGQLEGAEARAREALEAAERSAHPPTLCYALTHLYKDYYLLVGQAQAGEPLAARASELADKHEFAQCQRLIASARRKMSLTRSPSQGDLVPLSSILQQGSFYDF